MKADITRSTFEPAKHYSGVRMQQGRVQLDADLNEHEDILRHRIQTETVDVVGTGAPHDSAGFEIYTEGADLMIRKGRYYVDGVMCENDDDVLVTAQPDGPDGNLPDVDGTYISYLDVWTRHITALDDRRIREPALGGPDTATRLQTVWQVRFMDAGPTQPGFECLAAPAEWEALVAPRTAVLRARARPSDDDETPCVVPAAAGYRRLENQLYRVEIHDPGAPGAATFKWSRDNGSIVASWTDQGLDTLIVDGASRDRYLGFAAGNWVELTDDATELGGRPGTMVRLTQVDGDELTFDPATASGPTDRNLFARNPKVRRWDGADGIVPVEIPDADEGYIALESGIEVRFEDDAGYRTGDYWLIPARVNEPQIDWPEDPDADDPQVWDPRPRSPVGIRHSYARLAIVERDGDQWQVVSDCRRIFPAGTDQRAMYYVGGDGQEVAPNPLQPAARIRLDRPLQVGVSAGRWPVANAPVRFTVTGGGGLVNGIPGPAIVTTGADGVAACTWDVDSGTSPQQVEAVLLGGPNAGIHLPIRFHARLSVATRVTYAPGACTGLAGVRTVQEALDRLCAMERGSGGGCCVTVGERGEFPTLEEAIGKLLGDGRATDVCICLLPGAHMIRNGLQIRGAAGGSNVHIHGCGPATRVLLDRRLEARDLASLTLHAFSLELGARPVTDPIVIINCLHVRITDCVIVQTANVAPLVVIDGAERIDIANSQLESTHHRQLRLPEAGLFRSRELPDWTVIARELAERLFEEPQLLDRLVERYAPVLATLPAESRRVLEMRMAQLREEVIPARAESRTRTPASVLAAVAALLFGPTLVITGRPRSTSIDNTTIMGDIYMYAGRASALSDDAFLKETSAIDALRSVPAELQVAHSRITRVLVDQAALDAREGGVLPNVFSRWSFTDTVFVSPGTQMLAGNVGLSGSHFMGSTDAFLCIMRANTAVVVGNGGAVGRPQLAHRAPQGFAEAANLLTLRPY